MRLERLKPLCFLFSAKDIPCKKSMPNTFICAYCGKESERFAPHQKFCTTLHRVRYFREANLNYASTLHYCSRCGRWFETLKPYDNYKQFLCNRCYRRTKAIIIHERHVREAAKSRLDPALFSGAHWAAVKGLCETLESCVSLPELLWRSSDAHPKSTAAKIANDLKLLAEVLLIESPISERFEYPVIELEGLGVPNYGRLARRAWEHGETWLLSGEAKEYFGHAA